MDSKEATILRSRLVDALRGHESHIEFDDAIKDFPPDSRGTKPAGAPHTAWQLLEHMRIAQNDILEFSRDPEHQSPDWPEGYWPTTEAPPDAHAWDASVTEFRKNVREMQKLIEERNQDLFHAFEHGSGQTLLREALVLATHNSYHLGQLVFLKKILTTPR